MRRRVCGRAATLVLVLCGAAASGGASACGEVHHIETPDVAAPAPLPETSETPPAPVSTTEEGLAETENGQTGSLGPAECSTDLDCAPVLENWAAGDAEYRLLDSACEHTPYGSGRDVAPACICNVSVTRTARDFSSGPGEVSRQTGEHVLVLENDHLMKAFFGPQCNVAGDEPGECLYCDHEFPGCNVDASVNDCAAPCADAVERLQSAEQVTHDVELRVARCTAYGNCEVALRIDDACYNQGGVRSSCSLSDAEITSAAGEAPNPGAQCAAPALPCTSAEDCPAGLACNGSVCGACPSFVQCVVVDENGVCLSSDFACGDGEVCIDTLCVPAEQAACGPSSECPTTDPERDPRVCLVSSVDARAGRGNEETRSYCASLHPNLFGLRVGDVLEVRVLGPGGAVAATFAPPLSGSHIPPCGEGTGFAAGATLRVRVDTLAASASQGDRWPLARLLDEQAPIDSEPAPVHPRDPAEGHQLSGAPGNAAPLVFLPAREPAQLRGCTGVRDVGLLSLPDRREPGTPPREDGTFPTTVLEYRFFVEDESPACAEQVPEYSCQEMLLVEVTRLTP